MCMFFRTHRGTEEKESAASMFASADANQRPMYFKDKIYAGRKEYSFEELRAWNWTAMQREREKREVEYNQMRADIMYVNPAAYCLVVCCSRL